MVLLCTVGNVYSSITWDRATVCFSLILFLSVEERIQFAKGSSCEHQTVVRRNNCEILDVCANATAEISIWFTKGTAFCIDSLAKSLLVDMDLPYPHNNPRLDAPLLSIWVSRIGFYGDRLNIHQMSTPSCQIGKMLLLLPRWLGYSYDMNNIDIASDEIRKDWNVYQTKNIPVKVNRSNRAISVGRHRDLEVMKGFSRDCPPKQPQSGGHFKICIQILFSPWQSERKQDSSSDLPWQIPWDDKHGNMIMIIMIIKRSTYPVSFKLILQLPMLIVPDHPMKWIFLTTFRGIEFTTWWTIASFCHDVLRFSIVLNCRPI